MLPPNFKTTIRKQIRSKFLASMHYNKCIRNPWGTAQYLVVSTLMRSPKKNINCRLLQKAKASCIDNLVLSCHALTINLTLSPQRELIKRIKNNYRNLSTIPCNQPSTNYPIQAYSHSISCNCMTRQPCWMIIQKIFLEGFA